MATILSQETTNRGIGSKRKLSNSPSEHALKTTSPPSAPRNGRGAAMLASMGIQPPKQSPRKLKSRHQSLANDPAMLQTLPSSYLTLEAMFKALCTVYDMSRRRGLRTTFEKLKPAVEQACGRRFTLQHLSQMVSLLGNEIMLEWIRLPVAPMSARTHPQLLITLVNNNEKPPYPLLLRKSMVAHIKGAYITYLNRSSEEAVATGDVETATSLKEMAAAVVAAAGDADAAPIITNFRQGFFESKEARLPMALLPPSPVQQHTSAHIFFQQNAKVIHTASSNVMNNSNTTTTNNSHLASSKNINSGRSSSSVAGVSNVQAANSNIEKEIRNQKDVVIVSEKDLVTVQKRRLSFQTDAGKQDVEKQQPSDIQDTRGIASTSAAAADANTVKEATRNDSSNTTDRNPKQQQQQQPGVEFTGGGVIFSQEDFALLATLPEELRRRSLNGSISLDSVRKLDICAEQIRRLSGAKAIEMRRQKAALAALPKIFSRLERIFGTTGPRAMKLKDFLQRAKGEMETEGEIKEALQSLATIVPEYIELKAYGGCGTPAVWVNRGVDKRSVSQKVKVAAAKRIEMKL